MTYEGQPDYVRAGFLKDLFQLWMEVLPNDEWGRLVEAMGQLADAAVSCSDHERALLVVGWIREELNHAFEDEWWYDDVDGSRERSIRYAQDGYARIVSYWEGRAVSFKGEAALAELIAGLPFWVRPDPNAEPLPDPERQEYDRLHAKFGKG